MELPYTLNAKKFRDITSYSDDLYAETVTTCVEHYLGLHTNSTVQLGGSMMPITPPQIIQFLLSAGVLTENTEKLKKAEIEGPVLS